MYVGDIKQYIYTKKNSQAVKKWCGLKKSGWKSCEIKGGGQEMAAMMLMLKKFILVACIVKIY